MALEKEEKSRSFLFSVVMPIYNSCLFMREAIDSVLRQTIGFEDNIQLILVDDGSSDGSVQICREYAEEYPDNIIFHQNEKNSGVSVTRNNGIKYVKGEFVAFFDSDDIWPDNAFQKAYDFFMEHNDEIDVISCRMRFFGYKDGYFEGVDGKFKCGEDRVVDLREEYTALHHGVSSSFIRGDIVRTMQFDSTLTSGDDSKFLNTVILRRLKYGLLASVEYQYRKHSAMSVVGHRYSTKKYYTEVDRTLQYFVDLSMKQYGEVVKFIQYLMSYNIGVRMVRPVDKTILTDEELEEYRGKIKYYLSFIEDEVIEQTFTMHRLQKVYAYSLKHEDFYDHIRLEDRYIFYDDIKVYSLRRRDIICIAIIETDNNQIKLYGHLKFHLPYIKDDFFFSANGKRYPLKFDQHEKETESLGEVIYTQRGFSVEIPAEDNMLIDVNIIFHGETVPIKIKYLNSAALSNEYGRAYYYDNGILLTRAKNAIKVHLVRTRFMYEIKYMCQLLKRKKIGMIFLRAAVLFSRWFLKKINKQIWLFGDRLYLADDNGEFFYDYVKKCGNKNIIQYYIITKESVEFERIKAKTRYLIFKTFKYEFLYLIANYYLISTRRLPDGRYHEFFKDIPYKTIYLKHGFDGTDVSKFVNKLKVNDRMYLASAKAEYDSYMNSSYGYTDREIKLTGMPRDDLLLKVKDLSDHIICIAPTWRMYFALPIDPKTQLRCYDSKFKYSEFYKFYNSLMNDERLLTVMKRKGYKGVLQLHPNLIAQTRDFEANSVFSLQDATNKRFIDRYKGVDLCLTDYSSIAFEYALMDKSVIYAQFDKEKFYSTQYKEGYFDFEKDGFGPVCYDLDSTIDALIKIIEDGCKMDDKYEKRRKDYFEFFDGRNSERIYDELLKLK